MVYGGIWHSTERGDNMVYNLLLLHGTVSYCGVWHSVAIGPVQALTLGLFNHPYIRLTQWTQSPPTTPSSSSPSYACLLALLHRPPCCADKSVTGRASSWEDLRNITAFSIKVSFWCCKCTPLKYIMLEFV